jgi:pimeloyl-ACP methyl ester carboxylesterase
VRAAASRSYRCTVFPDPIAPGRAIAPELARDFFVIAPDQRGFGGSDRPDGVEAYRTDQIVADLIALADILELKQFTLVGHDWGGAVAWLAACAIRPDRAAGHRQRATSARLPESVIEDEGARRLAIYSAPSAAAARKGIRRWVSTPSSPSRSAAIPVSRHLRGGERAYLDDWGQPGALTAMLNWYQRKRALSCRDRQAQFRRRIGQICPSPSRDADAGGGQLGDKACSRSSSGAPRSRSTTCESWRWKGPAISIPGRLSSLCSPQFATSWPRRPTADRRPLAIFSLIAK